MVSDPQQSPSGVLDRFNSPAPGKVVRQLFSAGTGATTTVKPLPMGTVISATSSSSPVVTKESRSLLTTSSVKLYEEKKNEEGTSVCGLDLSSLPAEISVMCPSCDSQSSLPQVLIPVRTLQKSPKPPTSVASPVAPSQKNTEKSDGGEKKDKTAPSSAQTNNRPKKTGSLALFFRKVCVQSLEVPPFAFSLSSWLYYALQLYHLASVRLRDLCDRLDVDRESMAQMWTCFEHVLMEHIDLLRDRHLDQMIMCSIYVMAKVRHLFGTRVGLSLHLSIISAGH